MSLPKAYAAHESFVAPARSHAALWRLMAGFVLAAFAYFMLIQIYFQFIASVDPELPVDVFRAARPATVSLLLFSFFFMAAGVGISALLLHRRGFMTLIGPGRAALSDFGRVSALLLLLSAVLFVLPPWDMGQPLIPNLPVGEWLLILVPMLALVMVQVGAEEVVFRGYLQQQLAARFSSPIVWMGVPTAFFAYGHYMPDTAGENALIIAVWSGIFGLLLADLTARAGNLGPAIAMHFWNNVSGILIVAAPDGIPGAALYLSPFSMADVAMMRAWLPSEFMMALVFWLAARLALRR